MRMNRILTILIAVALLGFSPVAAGAATAPTGAGATAVSAGSTPATARSLPHRQIDSKVINVTRTKLAFKGKVKGDPTYAHKVVKIQRKLGKNKPWKIYAKTMTNSKGGWRHAIGYPRRGSWYFRAMTPKTGKYAKSYSGVWKTYAI